MNLRNCMRCTPDILEKLIDSWGKIHNAMVSRLVRELGREETLDVLSRSLEQLGLEDAKGQSAQNALEIADVIIDFESHFGIKGMLVEQHPDRVIREIRYCPWSYFQPESCEVLAAWVKGLCKGLNSNYEYKLTKAVPRGNKVCQWVIRKK